MRFCRMRYIDWGYLPGGCPSARLVQPRAAYLVLEALLLGDLPDAGVVALGEHVQQQQQTVGQVGVPLLAPLTLRVLLRLAAAAETHTAQKTAHFIRQPALVQMEAERRRREAGVQQAMENGLRSWMFV